MYVSSRVKELSDSITLKLNARAVALTESGRQVYNLTAGQLPFRPSNDFIDLIKSELNFIKSYQYSPVAGFPELRKKVMEHVERTRNISFAGSGEEFDCLVCNGGKHAISNVLGALIDPGDEVILMAPYWVSYPAIVKFTHGVPIVVKSNLYDAYIPSVDEIRKNISEKTRAIIINSPNNPAGIHYPDEWMQQFADLVAEYPDIVLISDEIYYQLSYYDPGPTYFYQKRPELLQRTIIIDGVSKTLASTGLRIGYAIAPTNVVKAMTRLQGQLTSGASSLIQRALVHYDFNKMDDYLKPILGHLRRNADTLRERLREAGMQTAWYQSRSAFYYFLDFSKTKCLERYQQDPEDKTDYADQICKELLEEYGIAMVPGGDFGLANSARMSIVLEKGPFEEALDILIKFLGKGR